MDGPPLQSLQQLIQWVGDFVLYLLANLPNQVRSCPGPGFENYWALFLQGRISRVDLDPVSELLHGGPHKRAQ